MSRLRSSLAYLSLSAALLGGCAIYDAPPAPFIEGGDDGSLDDPNLPIMLSFAEPVDPTTVNIKLVRFETDIEGNLADEDEDPETELKILFSSHPTEGDVGGLAEFVDNNSRLQIKPSATPPVGPQLAILVEKGLTDLNGNTTKTRKRIPFGYSFKLECTAPSAVFNTGHYFLLADIKAPLKVQVQLWAYFDVDPMTGEVTGQATNADRIKDPNRCPTPCAASEVCRLLPAPACVPPSEKAGTADEYSDYVPNFTPPTGYTFSINGCVVDQPDGSVIFATAPTDVIVQSPPVTLRNVTLATSFAIDADNVLRGSGSLAADQVLLGTTGSGKGEGSLTGRVVPPGDVPPDVPKPMP